MSNISELTLIGSRIRNFDGRIGELGLMETVKRLTAETKSRVEVSFDSAKTAAALERGPVAVVANHPHQSDVIIILAALPNRNDFSMIAMSSLLGMGKNIDRHIIPVYINHRAREKKMSENWGFRVFTKLHSYEPMTEAEEKLKNRESIALASDKLNRGEMMIIFPSGGGNEGKWFDGVGYMIKGAENPKLKVVMANISGSCWWDYFRLIPGFSKILPTIKIKFSAPMESAIFGAKTPKEITKLLKIKYDEWLEN